MTDAGNEIDHLVPQRLFTLEGETALVVGAGGLGRAVALGVAAAGADVAVADVDEGRAAAVVGVIERGGRRMGRPQELVGAAASPTRIPPTAGGSFGRTV